MGGDDVFERLVHGTLDARRSGGSKKKCITCAMHFQGRSDAALLNQELF